MRFLLYLLFFANIAVFLWGTVFRYLGETDTHRVLNIPSSSSGQIVLAHEASPDMIIPESDILLEEKPDSTSNALSHEGREVIDDCFLIGPLSTSSEGEELTTLLRSHTDKITLESKPGDIPEGWWVFFPQADSLEDARKNQQVLSEKGVVDVWLFDTGPLKWGISLGLHKTKDEAESAQKDFMKKNVVTQVVPRLVRGHVYWLRISWERPGLLLEEVVHVLNTEEPSLHIPSPIPCERSTRGPVQPPSP